MKVKVQHFCRSVVFSLSEAAERVGGYNSESVTRSRCDARPTVTVPFQPQSTAIAPWPLLITCPTVGRRLSWPEIGWKARVSNDVCVL